MKRDEKVKAPRCIAWAAVLGLLCLALPARAAPSAPSTAKGPHIQVRLLADKTAVKPGSELTAGVQFEMEKHWHVYWQNPGDSGQPPRIAWTLPQGITADPIQWPNPSLIPVGPLMNYGYEDSVVFPVPLHVAADAAAGKGELQAVVKWLVCAELCIPGSATLSIPLEVGSNESAQADASAILKKASAAIPGAAPAEWHGRGGVNAKQLVLTVEGPAAVQKATFLPLHPLQVEQAAPQAFMASPGGFLLVMQRSDQLLADPNRLAGLVQIEAADGAHQFMMDVEVSPVPEMQIAPAAPPVAAAEAPDVLLAILFAFLGGVVLNLMPCVFPVLSIKVMSLVQMSGHERDVVRRHAWLYAAGVLCTFWALTGALLGLRYAGEQIGWGFQLQSPYFVVVLASLLFLFALNLLGVFEIGTSWMGVGQSLASRRGAVGAFFTGVLATVVATPCTAPFMGSAVGVALSQPAAICVAIFTALGAGLAMPYVAICYIPAVAAIMPRPGAWMETLKQGMAFPLFATVVWLTWVFSQQTNADAVGALLGNFTLLGFAGWILGRWPQKSLAAFVGAALIVAGPAFSFTFVGPHTPSPEQQGNADELHWEAFSPEKVAALRAQGRPVFIDFTAAWCVSCKVNERLVFGSAEVRQRLKELDVALLKADWTSQDPVITQTLASFGRSGVPLYIMYGRRPNSPPIQLPEVITAGLVLSELHNLQ